MQAGVIHGPIERTVIPRMPPGGAGAPVHDLNVPYEGTEEYETPTAELLFPPVSILVSEVHFQLSKEFMLHDMIVMNITCEMQTPMQTPLQTPLPGMVQTPIPGSADASMYNIPTGGTDYSTPQEVGGSTELKGGRPSPYLVCTGVL